ncbi:hypothetical protein C8R44DRAFT_735247 [Mycena epipterygia]|nr:hypothetical protein C8R44DRAFT_735247 [Mycena epipterygia]
MSLQYMGFTELPQDVLLELAKELDVADLISVLATCRPARELQFQRTLWINAAARITAVQMQPLPLSNADELDKLSLQQLQDTVRRAHRLIQNLRSDNPRPVRIRNLTIGPSSEVFCIPGANLVVAHVTGRVSFWDILTSRCVGNLEIPDLFVRRELCLELKGRALIAAYTRHVTTIHRCSTLIRIDYRDRTCIAILHVISPAINDDDRWAGFFINSQHLGFCTRSSIVSWSMDGHAAVQSSLKAPLYCPGGEHRLSCQSFGERVYIFSQGSIVADTAVQSVPLPPTSRFPATTQLEPTGTDITVLDVPSSIAPSQRELRALAETGGSLLLGMAHLMAPNYGIFAVTFRRFLWEERYFSVVHFWPVHIAGDQLHFAPACFYEHPDPITRITVGTSGTYVVLMVDMGRVVYLGLLHFSATPIPHTTFRKLDIGHFPLGVKTRIALDDALGLVLVTDESGGMTAISYV